jgi:acyl-CoA synthetase (AMP-forming)/AMP-acid ligase II
MIIVGGENVFAAEVEAVLMNCDKVKEAAVKGIPASGIRESLGELIKAYVVPDDPSLTETDVRRHCHKLLPSYKLPHVIVFLPALPRNPAGKVVKDQLA